jgi:hypothetical protein
VMEPDKEPRRLARCEAGRQWSSSRSRARKRGKSGGDLLSGKDIGRRRIQGLDEKARLDLLG